MADGIAAEQRQKVAHGVSRGKRDSREPSRVAAKEKSHLIADSGAPAGAYYRRPEDHPTARAVGYLLDATPWLDDVRILRTKRSEGPNSAGNVEELERRSWSELSLDRRTHKGSI